MTEIFRDDCSTLDKWVVTGSPFTVVAARNGNGFQVGSSTTAATTYFPGPYEADTVVVGFAFRRVDTTTSLREIMRLYSDNGATEHNRLRWTASSSTLEWTRTSTSLVNATSITFTQNTWYYIEIKAVLHDTAGSVIVRVNGTEIINATGLDTKNAGTKTTYDAVTLRSGVSGVNSNQYDDVYIKTGSAETFLGDPGAVTTTTTRGQVARHSQRVATSPFDPGGAAVGRHSLRVAVPNPSTTPARVARISDRVVLKTTDPEARTARISERALVSHPNPESRLARQSQRALVRIGIPEAQVARITNRVLVPVERGAMVNVWTGAAFVDAPVKVWNGTAYVDATAVKVWNGTAFVDAV